MQLAEGIKLAQDRHMILLK